MIASRSERGRTQGGSLVWVLLVVALFVSVSALVWAGALRGLDRSSGRHRGGSVRPLTRYWSDTDERVVTLIRLPRILIALVIGGGLALSGAVLQGSFATRWSDRRSSVSPAGSGFGGALAIMLFRSQLATMGFAFVFGLGR